MPEGARPLPGTRKTATEAEAGCGGETVAEAMDWRTRKGKEAVPQSSYHF